MKDMDYKMTYLLDSDVPFIYAPFDIRRANRALPDFESRKAALLYVNSNCRPANNREIIVSKLAVNYSVPLDAAGKCLNNAPELAKRLRSAGGYFDKKKLVRHYRVCISMENSNGKDYVTEKIWDALAAGCVPLYLGAPNARADFLPTPDCAIMVEDYPTVEALAAEIKRVLTDRAAFEEYTAWRLLPFEQLSEAYRNLLKMNDYNPKCRMCQLLAERKIKYM
jgi:hypothetical protein